jgi:plastocyanin
MRIALRLIRNAGFLILIFLFCNGCSSVSTEKKPKAYTVEIKQMKFVPAELVLQKGDTVLFINHDLLTHDVTEQSRKAWSSTPLPPNSFWSLIVAESSDYYCSIHPVMKGKLVVK